MLKLSRKREVSHSSNALLFCREWLNAPLLVGAVAPSSLALGTAITKGIDVASAPVIELGPGTGVFTSALLASGIPQDRLALVETSEKFSSILAARYPGVAIIRSDADRLRHITPFGGNGAGAIVCGLPLMSMTRAKVMRIVSNGFSALRPGGVFRLFSYMPVCPVSGSTLDRLGLAANKEAFVPANVPPACVYTLQRKDELL